MATAIKATKKADVPVITSAAVGTTKKTTVAKNKEIKYTDKSADQPALVAIFNLIKSMMKPYAKGTVKERGEKPGMYHLVSEKKIETAGRKFDEIYFASIMVQKGFVGFYYMPVYSVVGEQELKTKLKPELLKCLKGKACFHIKKDNPLIMEQIKDALEIGYKAYEEKGWVE